MGSRPGIVERVSADNKGVEMNSNRLIVFLVIISAMIGCRRNPASFMAFDDVDYVHSVANSISLDAGKVVAFEQIGIRDIFICDSLMFVSTSDPEGLISVYEIPDLEYCGKFFYKGNGPGELMSSPFFGNVKVLESESVRNMLIGDGKGKVLSWDISTPFKDRSHDIGIYKDSLSLNSFYSIYVNDSTFMCRDISGDGSRQERYLIVNGKRKVVPSMEVLNKAEIPVKGDGYLFNILSSFAAYDAKHDRVVEASLMLNTINVYSLDGSFEKTICIGKSQDNISDICHYGIKGLRQTFVRLRIYDDFFAVMYSGGKEIRMSDMGLPNPKIYIFDWNCNPIAEFLLPEPASVFDIDFHSGELYTLDRSEEIIRKYNVKEAID